MVTSPYVSEKISNGTKTPQNKQSFFFPLFKLNLSGFNVINKSVVNTSMNQLEGESSLTHFEKQKGR